MSQPEFSSPNRFTAVDARKLAAQMVLSDATYNRAVYGIREAASAQLRYTTVTCTTREEPTLRRVLEADGFLVEQRQFSPEQRASGLVFLRVSW